MLITPSPSPGCYGQFYTFTSFTIQPVYNRTEVGFHTSAHTKLILKTTSAQYTAYTSNFITSISVALL